MSAMIKTLRIGTSDKSWIAKVTQAWGADFIVTCGRKVYPTRLPGYIAIDSFGKRIGLLSYEIRRRRCEIIIFEVFRQHKGIGTKLLKKTIMAAREARCTSIWLVTTNDNLDALRFYQRRGFTFSKIRFNAIALSRKIKPSIPKTGNYGIPIRDEIALSLRLMSRI